MAKSYKNLAEFIETTFPDYHKEVEYSAAKRKYDPATLDPICEATKAFNDKIDRIIKGDDEENKTS